MSTSKTVSVNTKKCNKNQDTKDELSHILSQVSTLCQIYKNLRRAYAMAFEKPFW